MARGTADRLWAPWRMAYIGEGSAAPGCLFCRVERSRQDRDHLVLARRGGALLMLNRFPYNPAHLMVAPGRHVGRFAALSDSEREDLLALLALGEDAVRRAYKPHGINVGANLGRVAGAGFPGHLHLHLVPRWNGDTNFMPVVAGTKVLPESLGRTWSRLRAALAGDPGAGARRRGRRSKGKEARRGARR
jgi:ATP adenylyltransferase